MHVNITVKRNVACVGDVEPGLSRMMLDDLSATLPLLSPQR